MSSILTNSSAMNALTALRSVNSTLGTTQDRIATGLKVSSAKDNAAYFSISETMKSDNAMYAAIDEGLTLTRNSVSTARLGTETVVDFASQIAERVAFAQANGVDLQKVQDEITGLVSQITTTIQQSTFNGDDLVNAGGGGAGAVTVVTGVSRASGAFATTTMTFNSVDLAAIEASLAAIDVTANPLAGELTNAEAALAAATAAATSLGVAEKSIENQQEFLTLLTDNIDVGVGKMIDANMEEEAAKLQSLQVQQQLSTQALSIANAAPQQLLALFR